jgi:hypothetical protein
VVEDETEGRNFPHNDNSSLTIKVKFEIIDTTYLCKYIANTFDLFVCHECFARMNTSITSKLLFIDIETSRYLCQSRCGLSYQSKCQHSLIGNDNWSYIEFMMLAY